MNYLIIVALLWGAWHSSECSVCSTMKVKVTGFRSSRGEGFLALYLSQDGYPLNPEKALQKWRSPIENGEAIFELKDIKPGNYAFIAMHDENKNGRMDRNLLGMPKEGYGASNNPHMPLLGPPTFESAVFETQPGEMKISIPLHYYPH